VAGGDDIAIFTWILAPVGSLQIYILLILDVLLDAILDIPYLYSFLLDMLVGLGP
jgi:hypothetical protein